MIRVLVSAWVGSGNLGDELILSATLRLLARHRAEVVVPSLEPEHTEATHGVRSIHHLDPIAMQQAISSADLVVFGGGGLVQDSTSPWSPAYQAARPMLSRLNRTPVVGLGLGAESLRRPSSKLAFRAALGRNIGLAARDWPSFTALARLGLSGVVETADLALTLPPPAVEPSNRIVVCLRSQPPAPNLVPGRWRRGGDAETEGLVAAFARGLTALSTRTGSPIRFVAMDARRDIAFAERLLSRLDVDADLSVPDVEGLVPEIARARLVISTRYHGGVVAALTGRPAVLLGYAPKVTALADDLAGNAALLPNRPEGVERIADTAQCLLDRQREQAPAASKLTAELRQRAERNASLLASAVTHPDVLQRASQR